MVAGVGFEPTKPLQRRIYSPLVLTAHPPRLSPRGDLNPLTFRLQVGCATFAPLGRFLVYNKSPPNSSSFAILYKRRAKCKWNIGSAYRIRTGDLLLEREVSLTPRRMRQHGWGRRIRTSPDGSRVHSPTARRSPNGRRSKNSH